MKDLRVIFMGTPDFAVPALENLIANTNVVLVVCQPDKEKDRKGKILFSPVKEIALKNNIEVYQPIKIKEEYQKILDTNPDIIITCAYGQIIPDIILNYPKYGCINIHGSLLPKYRGGAPIHWALINGEEKTGVTIMYMDTKMDSGDIISKKEIKIEDNDYLDLLWKKLSILGKDLLIETLPSIINNTCNRIKQNEEEVTFGMNIKKHEERIEFSKSSKDIYNLIRGLNSVPGAYCILENKRIKVYNSRILKKETKEKPGTIIDITKDSIMVACNDYIIELLDIKIEGKKRCLVRDYINGINKKELIGKVLE